MPEPPMNPEHVVRPGDGAMPEPPMNPEHVVRPGGRAGLDTIRRLATVLQVDPHELDGLASRL